ncbi:hypothetical protein BOTBODRAFT_25679 [Botryobasidium botryosum FD-172 SS1]|uniref:Zn(2)-C6 fungal-type domain-containing protein n=1 Tax=Botryobasidium botryosum (strain FD-172 SS1) TaxID=930990 RepID=A0A067NBV0_BOTB1|nr:hypothetical protein BOTBODRAFT_25679 [Botryobasidium botryosum FD-172 SS1]
MTSPVFSETYLVLSRGKACVMCRQRKRRCDAVKPICGTCKKAGLSYYCIYGSQDPEVLRIQEESLQERVAELETLIKGLETRAEPERSPQVPVSRSTRRLSSRKSSGAHPRYTVHVPSQDLEASSSTPIPLPIVDPYQAWWQFQDAAPAGIRDPLVEAFIRYRWQFAFEFNVPRFLASLDLPPSHPNAPHPCLLNAVMLSGCLYSSPNGPLRRYEPYFLKRMNQDMAQSLSSVDKLFDFLRASALAGCYFYGTSRLQEGYHYLSTAMRFAIGCGLNAIDTLSLDSQPPSQLLPPCTDMVELGDRINAFWGLYCVDSAGSLVIGAPAAASEREITTTWPCPWEYYQDGRALQQTHGNLSALYESSKAATWARDDNVYALRAKSIALLARASVLLARAKSNNPDLQTFRTDVIAICRASVNYAGSLPPYEDTSGGGDDPAANRSIRAIAFCAAYSAVIQSYGIFGAFAMAGEQMKPEALATQLRAANAAMVVVRDIMSLHYSYMPIYLGWALTPVHEFFIRERERLVERGNQESAEMVCANLSLLLQMFKRLDGVFPKARHVLDEILDHQIRSLVVRRASAPS